MLLTIFMVPCGRTRSEMNFFCSAQSVAPSLIIPKKCMHWHGHVYHFSECWFPKIFLYCGFYLRCSSAGWLLLSFIDVVKKICAQNPIFPVGNIHKLIWPELHSFTNSCWSYSSYPWLPVLPKTIIFSHEGPVTLCWLVSNKSKLFSVCSHMPKLSITAKKQIKKS